MQKYNAIPNAERPSLTETNVLHQFISPLLSALGWPIADPARCQFELSTQTGRPNVVLFPEAGGAVYVEAKRFGVIAPLAEAKNRLEGIVMPGQVSLPGKAADRTQPGRLRPHPGHLPAGLSANGRRPGQETLLTTYDEFAP
ncbi:MAG TPA: hypothetical protein PLD25_14720 [Chloroflexota bacterium]|nr:hypothetical protein [Chloroflexota bacterium]HUM67621.1 hypothetical protein [Chloroflexota bacterium]